VVTELSDRPRRVLLVEDDVEIAGMLTELLTGEGYQVDPATDGQRGLHLALTRAYDVLIIDRVLPALDGLDLIGRIRRKGIATPVLVLTALGTVADRVAGLDSGAEDYVVKPFEIEELLARVRALHRRHRDAARTLPLGAAEIDLVRRQVRLPDGAEVELSKREFELLRTLASHPRTVHTREDLQLTVFQDAAAESIVDTYVHYLRRKLGHGVVRTVRGFGYRLGEL
jgi:two-component system, OmpR family, response regulator QseB